MLSIYTCKLIMEIFLYRWIFLFGIIFLSCSACCQIFLSFCVSRKAFILFLFLKGVFFQYRILDWGLFFFFLSLLERWWSTVMSLKLFLRTLLSLLSLFLCVNFCFLKTLDFLLYHWYKNNTSWLIWLWCVLYLKFLIFQIIGLRLYSFHQIWGKIVH